MSANQVVGPGASPAAPAHPSARKGSRVLLRWSLLLGLLSVGYLLGAAVMFFDLPSAGFLSKAFVGARAWSERERVLATAVDPTALSNNAHQIDKPGKTFDGFTLFSIASFSGSRAPVMLMNMRRDLVHVWDASFSTIWPNPPQAHARIDGSFVCVFGTHLYPNGDLLAVFHGLDRSTNGYGLAKLDRDSKVIWKYSANVHHDVDVSEDGTIYALQQQIVQQMPAGLEFIRTPCLVDDLVRLSPSGNLLGKPIPILEAFRDSPYAPLLSALGAPYDMETEPSPPAERFLDGLRRWDALHTNSVKVLTRQLAPKFPLFKAGQVLISMRTLDVIAVLDPDTGAIVWAARGPWRAQHDPQFLENGHLQIFDNFGSPKGSRVLEYDVRTQTLPWSYCGENSTPFRTKERGMSQRLPNGNTLILNSDGGEVLEVSHEKEVVWTCSFPGRFVSTARRYSPDDMRFLKGAPRALP
jgi:hypothetical protein